MKRRVTENMGFQIFFFFLGGGVVRYRPDLIGKKNFESEMIRIGNLLTCTCSNILGPVATM